MYLIILKLPVKIRLWCWLMDSDSLQLYGRIVLSRRNQIINIEFGNKCIKIKYSGVNRFL